MFCTACGTQSRDGWVHCFVWGEKLAVATPLNAPSVARPAVVGSSTSPPSLSRAPVEAGAPEAAEVPRQKGWFLSLFDWTLDEDELRTQIAGYSTLGWTKSFRKLSAALLIFSTVLTLGMGVLLNNLPSVAIDAALFALLAPFVYRGHRWAILSAMALWTLEKAMTAVAPPKSLSASTAVIQSVIFWAIYMGIFVRAFRVEWARRRRTA